MTSSPTIDLSAQAAIAGHRPGRDRGVDPLVVRDGDDVEIGPPLDVVEDRLDPGRAVAGQRVDVQVGATEPLVDAVMPRRPGGRIRVPSAGAPPAVAASRSGQIGKKTAHHWSGASAMSVSNAAASRVIVVVTRSRRVPSVGTSIGMSLPRKWPFPARRTVIA